jgi:hypothetical protein
LAVLPKLGSTDPAEPQQDQDQLVTLTRCERRNQLLVGGANGRVRVLQCGLATAGELDLVRAPIFRIKATLNKTQRFEMVNDGHHRRAVEAQEPTELALRQRPNVLQRDEDTVVASLQLQRLKACSTSSVPCWATLPTRKPGERLSACGISRTWSEACAITPWSATHFEPIRVDHVVPVGFDVCQSRGAAHVLAGVRRRSSCSSVAALSIELALGRQSSWD